VVKGRARGVVTLKHPLAPVGTSVFKMAAQLHLSTLSCNSGVIRGVGCGRVDLSRYVIKYLNLQAIGRQQTTTSTEIHDYLLHPGLDILRTERMLAFIAVVPWRGSVGGRFHGRLD
jgi:hypothetical protein